VQVAHRGVHRQCTGRGPVAAFGQVDDGAGTRPDGDLRDERFGVQSGVNLNTLFRKLSNFSSVSLRPEELYDEQ
jgi:hypothetical protein